MFMICFNFKTVKLSCTLRLRLIMIMMWSVVCVSKFGIPMILFIDISYIMVEAG
jgi:hypothetical protein